MLRLIKKTSSFQLPKLCHSNNVDEIAPIILRIEPRIAVHFFVNIFFNHHIPFSLGLKVTKTHL